MFTALTRRVLCFTRMCQVPGCSGRAPKDLKTGVIILIYSTGRETGECFNYRGVTSASMEKCNTQCLEKRCRETIEPMLEDAHASQYV